MLLTLNLLLKAGELLLIDSLLVTVLSHPGRCVCQLLLQRLVVLVCEFQFLSQGRDFGVEQLVVSIVGTDLSLDSIEFASQAWLTNLATGALPQQVLTCGCQTRIGRKAESAATLTKISKGRAGREGVLNT